jgi:TRAP transporter TAXI family solute receptor
MSLKKLVVALTGAGLLAGGLTTAVANEMDIGVAQSDVQFNAVKGEAQFKDKAYGELRAIFALHPEPITLMASKNSGIKGIGDLKGKRVNVGPPGSGTQASVVELFAATGIKMGDLALTADAFFYTVGHPSANIQDPATTCGAKLVSLTGAQIERLAKSKSYYSMAKIPAKLYPGNDDETSTYGVRATLVTSAKVPADTVYLVVKAVFENFDEFKKLHPALASLSPQDMVANGLSAPLHDGARRYYREKGWIK